MSKNMSLEELLGLEHVIKGWRNVNTNIINGAMDEADNVRNSIQSNIKNAYPPSELSLEEQLNRQTFSSHLQLLPEKFTKYLCKVLYDDSNVDETKPEILTIAAIICNCINSKFTTGYSQRLTLKMGTSLGITDTLGVLNHLGLTRSYNYFAKLRSELPDTLQDQQKQTVLDMMRNTLIMFTFDNVQCGQIPTRAGYAFAIYIALSTIARITPDDGTREWINKIQNNFFTIIFKDNDNVTTENTGNNTTTGGTVGENAVTQSDSPMERVSNYAEENDDQISISLTNSSCEMDDSNDSTFHDTNPSIDIRITTTGFPNLQFLCGRPADFMLPSDKDMKDLFAKLVTHIPNDKGHYPTYGRDAATTKDLPTTRAEMMRDHMFALPIEPLNPSSEDSCRELLETMLKTLNDTGKKWIWVSCDGVPHAIIRKLQLEDWRNNNEREYYRIVLLGGFLHEEMTMLKALMKMYHEIGILEAVAKVLKIHSTSFLECKDTHKTRTAAFIAYVSLKKAAIDQGILTVNGWKGHLTKFENLLKNVITVGCAFELFMRGVRTKNVELILLGRKTFYPLYFTFNHHKYARIVADDTADIMFLKRHINNELLDLRMEQALLSISSLLDMHQGADAIQEEINKEILKILGMNNTVSIQQVKF